MDSERCPPGTAHAVVSSIKRKDFMKYQRMGEFWVPAMILEIFPLLCPKKEEEWIPGWECEVISSKSGCNEENAIFRTRKPYGTGLIWHTLAYDLEARRVDFFITASHLYNFRFKIRLSESGENGTKLMFSQEFFSISEEGTVLIEQYRNEDFQARLLKLGEFMTRYLKEKRTISQ